MRQDQIDILIECQVKLIKSLTPLQYDNWMQWCETRSSGSVLDGINYLVNFIETNRLP